MIQIKKNRKSPAKNIGKPRKKNIARPKLAVLSRFVPKSKKTVIKTVLFATLVVAFVGSIPLPHTFEKSATIPFATDTQKNAGLELGDSKVLQEGRKGSKVITVSSLQSLWGRLLGWQPIQQKETDSTVTEEPVAKIIANGTRKYQYMMCSDGSYRYYTDKQFKDEYTGFTSKSQDYCKENNQGVKLKLADSLDGSTNNIAAPPASVNTPTPRGCTRSSIPHGTEYQNVSYLPRGTRQVASEGMDGFVLRCPGLADVTSLGVNQLVLVGTGKTDGEIQAEKDAEEVKRQQEETARDQRYYLNLANCIQSLKAQGASPSSAESHCRNIIRR